MRILLSCLLALNFALAEQHTTDVIERQHADENCITYPLGNYLYATGRHNGRILHYSPTNNVLAKIKFDNLGTTSRHDTTSVVSSKGSVLFEAFSRSQDAKHAIAIHGNSLLVSNGTSVYYVKNFLDSNANINKVVISDPYKKSKLVQFSREGKYAAHVESYVNGGEHDKLIKVRNLKKGESISYDVYPDSILDLNINDETSSITAMSEEWLFEGNLDTRKFDKVKRFPGTTMAKILPGGKDILLFDKDENLKIVTKEGEEKASIPMRVVGSNNHSYDRSERMILSPDGKKVAVLNKGSLFVVDLATKSVKRTVPSPTSIDSMEFSKDGKFLALQYGKQTDKDISTIVLDTSGKELKKVQMDKSMGAISFDSDSSSDLSLFSTNRTNGPMGIKDFNSVCVNPVNIEVSSPFAKKLVLDKLKSSGACKDGAKHEADTIAGDVNQVEGAYSFLFAMQKPNAFKPERDLSKLVSLLRANFHSSDPQLISGAMLNVMRTSNVLYEKLVEEFPKLTEIRKNNSTKFDLEESCIGENELKEQQKAAQDYMMDRIKNFLDYDDYHSLAADAREWKYIAPFTPYYSSLPEDKRHEHVEWVGDTVDVSASKLPFANVVEPVVLQDFASDTIRDIFGYPVDKHTHAYLERTNGNVHLLVLGSDPIDSNDRNEGAQGFPELGFHMRRFFLNPSSTEPQKITWKHNNETWRATVQLGETKQTITSAEVKKLLEVPKSCKFVAARSHWVEDGVLAERLKEEPSRAKYVKTVSSPNSMLQACEEMKIAVGEGGCDNIEFSGHSGGACATREVYGLSRYMSRVGAAPEITTSPSDKSQFDKVNACFDSLLNDKKKPLIFTSCFSGGYADGMKALSEMHGGRPIIGAVGLCSSDGWGAYCRKDFTLYDPSKGKLPVVLERVD